MIANCTATGADTSVHVNTKLFDTKEPKTMHGEIEVEKLILTLGIGNGMLIQLTCHKTKCVCYCFAVVSI